MGWLARAGIISGVLMLSAALGYRRPTLALLVILALFGLGSALVMMRWPALGIVLTVIGGIGIPYYGPSGFNITMAGIGMLLGLWVLELIIYKRGITTLSAETTRPMVLLLAVATLSFVVGQLPWYPTTHAPLGAQLGGLALFILSVGAFLLIGNRVNSLGWLQTLTFSFVAYASIHVISWFLGPLGQLAGRLFQWGSTNGSLFWLWLVTLAFSQAVFNRRLHPVVRGLLALVTLLTLYVTFVYQNDWKSGWIPPLVSIGVMLMARSKWFVIAFSIMGSAPAFYLAMDAIASDEYSYSTRLDAYAIVAEIAKANPIVGLGPANYYWYTPLFPIRGYAVQFNSHSQYIDLFAQVGILGFICFLWCFWSIGKLAWRLRTTAPEGFARAYVYGALGGVAGTLVAGVLGDWVVPFFYNVGMAGFRSSVLAWLFLGGLLVIEKCCANETTRVEPAS